MKTKLFNFILVGTLLATGVVSAYTEPTGTYPNGQVETVVNVGGDQQVKTGAFWAKLLQAGSKVSNTAALAGFMLGEAFTITPSGFFTHMVLPGNDAEFRLGGIDANLLSVISNNESTSLFGFIFGNLNRSGDEDKVNDTLLKNRAPFTIDLTGRGKEGSPASRDALAVIATNQCKPVTIVTDAPGISFRSDYNKALADENFKSDYADILARQVQLQGGDPGANKVLVAVDSFGNATWGTLKFTPETRPGPSLKLGACVKDPAYMGPPNQIACAAGQDGQCPPCENIKTESQCNANIAQAIHCKWDPNANTQPGDVIVTGMKVEVVYDKNDSPVRLSQMMCGLEDPEEPEDPEENYCVNKFVINVSSKVFSRNPVTGNWLSWSDITLDDYQLQITDCDIKNGTAKNLMRRKAVNPLPLVGDSRCLVENGFDAIHTNYESVSLNSSCTDVVYANDTKSHTEIATQYQGNADTSNYKIERSFEYKAW